MEIDANDTPLLVSASRACQLLSVSRNTLTQYERSGRLVPVDITPNGASAKKRTLRYSVESLRDFARGAAHE